MRGLVGYFFYCLVLLHFHSPPYDSGGVLWFHVGHLCIRPSICPSISVSFLDNLSKHQWIFTKLAMYIDIVEIWFRIADGQIS